MPLKIIGRFLQRCFQPGDTGYANVLNANPLSCFDPQGQRPLLLFVLLLMALMICILHLQESIRRDLLRPLLQRSPELRGDRQHITCFQSAFRLQ